MKWPALIAMLYFSAPCIAQDGSNEKLKPLILIDTLLTYNESMILHPSKFVSISIINAQKATELYGITGRFGVIRIQTVQDIQLVRLTAILDKFKVAAHLRNLKVCIDRELITEPEKLLADIKEIRNVEVIPAVAVNNIPAYINIITR